MFADVVPQPQQVFAVALDFRLRPIGPGGAHDHPHAARNIQLRHHLLQPAPIRCRGDFPRNPAAARRVRHQHAKPSRQGQIRCQCRALGAALFLDHLHQQDLPAANDFLNLVVAQKPRRQPPLPLVVAAFLIATAHCLRRRQDFDGITICVKAVIAVGIILDDPLGLDLQRLR